MDNEGVCLTTGSTSVLLMHQRLEPTRESVAIHPLIDCMQDNFTLLINHYMPLPNISVSYNSRLIVTSRLSLSLCLTTVQRSIRK